MKRAVRIALKLTDGIEDHRRPVFGCESWPIRQSLMVGISAARKIDPRITDFGRQGARFGTAAGNGSTAISVIEDKW